MAFNALVGNSDDHALNTGLLFAPVEEGSHRSAWGLAPRAGPGGRVIDI